MNKNIALIVILIFALGLSACSGQETGKFEGGNGKWSITLTDKLVKGDAITEAGMVKTSFTGSDGIDLVIIEVADPGYVADEKRLEEETTQLDELEPTRAEVLDIANFGKVYGALITDHQLANDMFYYMTNVGDDVIYFMFIVKTGELTENREKLIKSMITSLELK